MVESLHSFLLRRSTVNRRLVQQRREEHIVLKHRVIIFVNVCVRDAIFVIHCLVHIFYPKSYKNS